MDNPVYSVDNSPQPEPKTAILGIFAKQPLPGQCKTRLCPPLTPDEAAALYQCSLRETVARMQAGHDYDLVICYAGERSWFEQAFPGQRLIPQQGADLGARMATALDDFLCQGYERAVLIGSDAPDLPRTLVAQAFAALQQHRLVIVPAADGGYVLIGEAGQHQPPLFAGINWSTAEVLPETLRRAEQLQLTTSLLPGWEDLDDLASLENFLLRSPQSKTANFLQMELARLFPPGN